MRLFSIHKGGCAMNLDKLLQEAKDGNMVAQYDLAEYYGKLLKNTTEEKEIYDYSRQAILWLKQSAAQGYGPAVDAINELNVRQNTETAGGETAGENAAPAAGEAEVPKPKKNGRVNIVLACMLTISMIVNVFLLIYSFGNGRLAQREKPSETISSSEPSEAPVSTETTIPQVTESALPTEELPTISEEPTVEPSEEPFWLDLSGYTDLEVIPDESDIFDDYEYHIVTSNSNLNMRSGPSTDYQKVSDGIPSGTRVGAVSERDGWYLIFYNEQFAWVSGSYLS